MMLSISQYGIRSPMRAISSSRASPSVVPGRVRQSTCTSASPGITLYLMPACMIVGLNVSRSSASSMRAYAGSQAARSAAADRRGSSPTIAAMSAAWSGGRAAPTSASSRRTTGVGRGSLGTAMRVTTWAARTSALSSRGIEP